MSWPRPYRGWDRVPRLDVRIGTMLLPAWTAMGRVGALAGALLFASLAAVRDVPLWVVGAIVGADVLGFVGWTRVRALLLGKRRYVLLEHVALAAGLMVAVSSAADVPLIAVSDAWASGAALLLASGRLGCLFMGCCHGRIARRGVRYAWLAPWRRGAPWHDLRVFPIQAVEMMGLLVLSLIGSWLTVNANGAAAEVVPIAYVTARFVLEVARGDRRPYLGRLSYNQWACLLVLVAAATFGDSHLALAGLVIAGATAMLPWARPPRDLASIASSDLPQRLVSNRQ